MLFQEYSYEGKTPFALDKRNRNAFFTIPVSGLYSIWKRNIDDLFIEEVGLGVLNVWCIYVYIYIYWTMYVYVCLVCWKYVIMYIVVWFVSFSVFSKIG